MRTYFAIEMYLFFCEDPCPFSGISTKHELKQRVGNLPFQEKPNILG